MNKLTELLRRDLAAAGFTEALNFALVRKTPVTVNAFSSVSLPLPVEKFNFEAVILSFAGTNVPKSV